MKTLTADTKIRLSQIIDLKDWVKDEAAPEGTVHHWSDGDHIKKNGEWIPVEETKANQEKKILSAKTKIRIKLSKNTPLAQGKPVSRKQKKELKHLTVSYDVSKINEEQMDIIIDSIKKMRQEYQMQPLQFIQTSKEDPRDMGITDGYGIYFGEEFIKNPRSYYEKVIKRQQKAREQRKRLMAKNSSATVEELELLKQEIELDMVRSNVLYEGKELECVALHELAHVLANQKLKILSVSQTEEMREKYKALENVYQNALLTGDVDRLSTYARTNKDEFFAEAFVVYKMGIEKIPDYIKDVVEDILL